MPSSDAQPAASKRQRADARRNVAAILDAATECLARDPEVSIADIATAAGVGRITLYGHFKTRAELIDAVVVRTTEHCAGCKTSSGEASKPAPSAAICRSNG